MAELALQNLSAERSGITLVRRVSLTMKSGELIALVGPNGAGKTSLLRSALGLQKPSGGSARADGKDTAQMTAIERAKLISYLPQTRPLAWPTSVQDVVALGRFSYGARLGKLAGEDLAAVTKAMRDCDIEQMAHRAANTLSGGESARMHCARAFAAQAPLLIADEPVAALDPRHQLQVMQLIEQYVQNGGGALVVLHDINLAARFASRIVWLKAGEIVADGTPVDTLTAPRLADVFAVNATVNGLQVEFTGAL